MRIRALDPLADRSALERLWHAGLAPDWHLLADGLHMARAGLVAEHEGDVVGAVAIDPAGSILLVLVDPGWRRRGVGTELLESATDRLRALGCRSLGPPAVAGVPDGQPIDRLTATLGSRPH